MRQGNLEAARDLVFGADYARHKKLYSEGMETTLKSLREGAAATTESYGDNMRTSVLVVIAILVLLALGWTSVIRLMRAYLRECNAAVDGLSVANATLEHRVAERTHELAVSVDKLREAQDVIVASARAAGMSEVAANVLHNVGNVLNSINVAAQIADESLANCRIASIRKAADMLDAEKADLSRFLATDKGAKLAAFLREATANIATSHDRARGELEHLKSGIEHVKAIVATQQQYAHAKAHVDTFELADLIESAIRLSTRHAIEIENRVPAGLVMTTDMHRLMEIVLNLIKNACEALADMPDAVRRIEIDATAPPGQHVRLSVRDHGVGIDAAEISKLFRHGFTTKPNGHGFGLHSSASAASDLGGTILVNSDGIGSGATFIVEIPARNPKHVHTAPESNAPRAFEGALQGLDRIRTIVQAMRTFGHHDDGQHSAVDLNAVLQSTLEVARNEYRMIADIESDLGSIPLVTCCRGELGQVFLNLIINATHAIDDVVRGTGARGRIRLRTEHVGDEIVISIEDTGNGIPANIRDRIFDPFFTTKDVGRGTGQGLSISRAIVVERHGGTIDVSSVIGQGATFIVRLPVTASDRSVERKSA